MNSLLLDLLDPREVVAYRPALARALGSPLAALFLCQACHWQVVKGVGEWFYKLRDAARDADGRMVPPQHGGEQSWEWETGMGRSAQQTARKILRDLGLVEEREGGIPNRLYFRVNIEKLGEFLAQTQENRQLAESDQQEGNIQPTSWQNPTNKKAGSNRQGGSILPSNTKTTTSTTHGTTQSTPQPPAGAGSVRRRVGRQSKSAKPNPTISQTEAFKVFWQTYPKQIHLSEAVAIWNTEGLDSQCDTIMAGLDRWLKSADWKKDDGRYIPAPDKWLDALRWLDMPAEHKATTVIKSASGRVISHERGNVERDYGKTGSFSTN